MLVPRSMYKISCEITRTLWELVIFKIQVLTVPKLYCTTKHLRSDDLCDTTLMFFIAIHNSSTDFLLSLSFSNTNNVLLYRATDGEYFSLID